MKKKRTNQVVYKALNTTIPTDLAKPVQQPIQAPADKTNVAVYVFTNAGNDTQTIYQVPAGFYLYLTNVWVTGGDSTAPFTEVGGWVDIYVDSLFNQPFSELMATFTPTPYFPIVGQAYSVPIRINPLSKIIVRVQSTAIFAIAGAVGWLEPISKS